MADNIPGAFKNGTLYTDHEPYTFLKLPITSAVPALDLLKSCYQSDDNDATTQSSTTPLPFQTFMIDKDEITIMILTSQFERKFKVDDFPAGFEQGPISYRLITFDVVLAPTLVGFMAVVTRALADANVSVLPFAAYSRDHIFVSSDDFDTTIKVLETLKNSTTTTNKISNF